jgi:hypothetical protein
VLNVEITVRGRIDPQWSEWFGDLAITHVGQDQSRLTGTVIDQAALYGILAKLRDLSLALISVSVDAVVVECKNDTGSGYECIGS